MTLQEAFNLAKSCASPYTIKHILSFISGKSLSFLDNITLSRDQEREFLQILKKLEKKIPLEYILGQAFFMGYEFHVNENVLIPREESATLIEEAEHRFNLSHDQHLSILDVGTGSGIIAITMALKYPYASILATDISLKAIEIAYKNACFHQVEKNITFQCHSWLENVNGEFDFILSNPPYLSEKEINIFGLSHEPSLALSSLNNGFYDIECLSQQAFYHLKPGQGWLLLEHGWHQGGRVRSILHGYGYTMIQSHQDQFYRERVTVGRRPFD